MTGNAQSFSKKYRNRTKPVHAAHRSRAGAGDRAGEGRLGGGGISEPRSRSAEAPRSEPTRVAPIAERHYYRTGRDTQFNTKVRADTKAAYMAIATETAYHSARCSRTRLMH